MVNEKITEIKELMKQRRTLIIKEKLDELDKDLEKLDNFQKFFDEVKSLVRNSGRTNMISISSIEELIIKHSGK